MGIYNVFLRKVLTAFKKPKMFLIKPLNYFSFLFNDRTYLKLNFHLRMGKPLNLEDPKTFNEKLQWLKVNYREAKLTRMVDKYEAKLYVSELIGPEYVIPTLGVWNTYDEIDFEALPSQFVLKTTHDQGGVVICKDKGSFNYKSAKDKLNRHLKGNHFLLSREWPYKNVVPRIIAEKYMVGADNDELVDYKFFCFNGVPKALYVASERQTGKVKFNYFDINFNKLDLSQAYEESTRVINRPSNFDEMVSLAGILSAGLPHVRVDFYNCQNRIYFGELTFFHHGGHTAFHPEEWDYIFGSWLSLPSLK